MRVIVSELARWLYWYPFRILIHRVPISLAYKIAGLMVPLFFHFATGRKNAISRGLSTMYAGRLSKREINKLIFETLDNSLKTAVDVLFYPKFNKKYCEENIEYIGLENLDKALKAKCGAVLLHGHFGNPHMIMPAIGFKEYKLSQLASRTPPEKLHGIVNSIIYRIRKNCYEIKLRFKESLPVSFIYIDGFMRAPFETLKRNEMLAVGIDGREGVKSVEVNFLNHRAFFYTGSMRLIIKAKSIILPSFHVRNLDNSHKIIIEKPMELELTGSQEEDIKSNILKFVGILEKKIYEYPRLYADAFCLGDAFFIPAQSEKVQKDDCP